MNALGPFLLAGVVWMGLLGRLDPLAFVIGGLAGVLLTRAQGLRLTWHLSPRRLGSGLAVALELLALFSLELLLANLQQLRLVLAPRLVVRPRWLRYRTTLETPALRALLGVMVSMTPGTLTVEEEGDELIIHVLDAAGEQEVAQRIRRRLEAPLRRLEER